MQYALTQTVAPTAEPVTRDQVKMHLRSLDISAEDSLIDLFIPMARGICETETGRQFMLATYTLQLDEFPHNGSGFRDHHRHGHSTFYGEIRLPKPPLSSVTSVAYVDTAGDTQTLTVTTDYVVDSSAFIPRIVPAYGTTWPSTRVQPNAVTVTYVSGYASADAVPAAAKGGIFMLANDLDQHRSFQSELRLTKTQTVLDLLATISVLEAA